MTSRHLCILFILFSFSYSCYLDHSWPKLPPQYTFGPVAGVDADSAAGEIYVAQRGPAAPPILIIDSETGLVKRKLGQDVVSLAHTVRIHRHLNESGADIDTLEIWVPDAGAHVVWLFDALGRVVGVIGTPYVNGSGTDPVQFNQPTDIAFDDEYLYIADGDDALNNRILKFQRAFRDFETAGEYFSSDQEYPTLRVKLVSVFGTRGSGPGQFVSPHALVVDRLHRLWVADRGNARIQVFHPETHAVLGIWSCIWAPGRASPWGIALLPPPQGSASGRSLLAVADGAAFQVELFWVDETQMGDMGRCAVIERASMDPASNPHALTFDAHSGAIYTALISAAPQGAKCLKVICPETVRENQ